MDTGRLAEYKNVCRTSASSAVAKNYLDSDYKISFDKAKIICKKQNTNKRRIVEGALSQMDAF